MPEPEYRVLFSLAEPGDPTPAIAVFSILGGAILAGLITWGLVALFN